MLLLAPLQRNDKSSLDDLQTSIEKTSHIGEFKGKLGSLVKEEVGVKTALWAFGLAWPPTVTFSRLG